MTWHAKHTFGRQNQGRRPDRSIREMAAPAKGFILKRNQLVNYRRLTARLTLFPKNPLRLNIANRLDPLEMARFTGHPYVGVVRHFIIMRGMALFNQKRLEQARSTFQRAQADNRSRHTATQWIAYVDSEIKRRDLMVQDVEYKPRERDDMMDVIEGQQE